MVDGDHARSNNVTATPMVGIVKVNVIDFAFGPSSAPVIGIIVDEDMDCMAKTRKDELE